MGVSHERGGGDRDRSNRERVSRDIQKVLDIAKECGTVLWSSKIETEGINKSE